MVRLQCLHSLKKFFNKLLSIFKELVLLHLFKQGEVAQLVRASDS
jgi:hypothetical protein